MTYITTHSEPRSNRAAVWLSSAVLIGALAWLGDRLVFAQFQGYDDEGYLLVTVQQFLRGRPLYDEIYTQYGPAYYLWQQVLHALIGVPLTHDATRVVTVVVWVMCAVLVGAIVWLLTKRRLLTVLGTTAAFLHLTQLTLEPGHPQELCLLGVLGAIALTTWRLVEKGRLGMAASAAVGGLVAVTALSKVNVGAFLAAALALGLVTSLRRFPRRTGVERIVMAAAMAVAPALMRGDLLRPDIAAYVSVVWCGLLAVFLVRSSDAAEEGVVTVWDVAAGVSAFAIGCVVVVAGIVYEGTSPKALFEGLFVAPLLLSKVFWRPLPVPALVAAAAPLTLLAAWCWRRGIRPQWLDFAALASGPIMFMLSLTTSYRALFAVGPLLAWLVLSDRTVGAEQRAARRILAFAAILNGLQAYPMPEGTQIVIGTVLFVPLALVMIASALQTLDSRDRSAEPELSFGGRAVVAVIGVAAAAGIGTQAQRLYARGTPLELPGTRHVRTTARSAATYWWLSANLRDNCDAFITAPGFNSLHFWTEMPPLTTLNTTVWPLLFDDAQQRRILEAAAPVDRLCVAWSPGRMAVLTAASDVASRPLVAWLQREFEPRGRAGNWELRMRRGRAPVVLYQGLWDGDESIVLDLPAMGHDPAVRVAMVTVDTERTLADSARGEEIVVLGEDGTRLRIDAGIDLSRRRRITLRPAVTAASALRGESVVIRLWNRDGRSLATVPVGKSAPDHSDTVSHR